MVHMLVPQPSGDGFVQVNSFILALQAGFTACTKAAGCPGHKAFTRLAFCQPHSARDWCVPWSGFPTQQNISWKLNSAAAEKSDMVIREQSYAIQDFLCATFIWIDSQVILRENSSISVGKRKFEREDTEVIRVFLASWSSLQAAAYFIQRVLLNFQEKWLRQGYMASGLPFWKLMNLNNSWN